MQSTLPPGLIQAYCDTQYKINGPEEITLTVGQFNPALLCAHRKHRVNCSAFITSCNPLSTALSVEENLVRQVNLAAKIRLKGLSFEHGIGQHPTNGWAGEPSFFVFGLIREEAMTLCSNLEQNGFIWIDADAVPQLILLR